jgi:hypothetical protein
VAQTTPTGVFLPKTILHGTYSDGGGLAEIYARIQGPDGSYWSAVKRTSSTWRFAPELSTSGIYSITLQAYDRAGNSRSYGPFYLIVMEGGNVLYLPFVTSQ